MRALNYDAKGNLTAVTDPEQNKKPVAERLKTTIAYNSFGQPISTTDPLGNITRFEYDAVGNLTATIDSLGNRSKREYDVVGRLIKQIDPRGRPTTFTYDALNRLTKITDPATGVTQFTYDGNGNLLTVTDARGNIIAHTYDSMDRLATRTDPVGAVESFQYDPLGNLTQHTDRKSHVNTFSYDALNRRLGAGYADGATTSFIYDAIGRLIQATDSVGGTIVNQYDILDRLVNQITSLGAVSYQYDSLGRRKQMDTPGQSPVSYSYDAASRLTQVAQGAQVVDLVHDALGRRTRLTLPNEVSTEYQYDAASRLTALIYRNALGMLGDLTYQYDTAGNRTRVGGSFARTVLPDPIPSATYDAANRQLTFGDKTMTFDANGNLTSITDSSGLTTFTWDARNRLLALSGPATMANFTYDALSRRIAKEINGEITQYLYDTSDTVQELINDTPVTYLRSLKIDEPFIRNGIEFYLTDGLGSVLGLTDLDASVTTRYTYEPFGRSEVGGVTSQNPFRFTAREDDGTGFYFYRARHYWPQGSRFTSEDPIGPIGGSFNLYLYARSNPILFIDPTGFKTWIYAQESVGVGFSPPWPLSFEGGSYHLVDPYTGEVHSWDYFGGGVGLSVPLLSGAAQLQAGLYDGPEDPTQISNWGLEISGFAAAGYKGASFSLGSTSFWGNGENWGSGGWAGGIGAGISGIVTRSWYRGKSNVVPEFIREVVKELAKQIRGKK